MDETFALIVLTLAYSSIVVFDFSHIKGHEKEYGWIHPLVMFVAPFSLYTLAMPFSRLVFRSELTQFDVPFLFYQTLALGGFSLGYFLVARRTKIGTFHLATGRESHLNTFVADLALIVTLCITVYAVTLSSGGILAYITNPYGSEVKAAETGGLLDGLGITSLSAILVLVYCYLPQFSRGRRYFYMVLVFLVAIFLLMGGYRNLVIWLILPLAVIWQMRHRRIRSLYLLMLMIVGFVLFQTIGVIRQTGFGSLEEGIGVVRTNFPDYLDPMRQELGTSWRVFRIWEGGVFNQGQLYLGRTYLIDPVLNIVPILLWPDRPDTIALEFSKAYYYGQQLLGLGFSGVTESLANFGGFGPLVIFFILGRFTKLFFFGLSKGETTGWVVSTYAVLLPAFVNFNRMDFAVLVKLFVIRVAAIYLVDRMARIQKGTYRQPIERIQTGFARSGSASFRG